jgi:hypothetical protein
MNPTICVDEVTKAESVISGRPSAHDVHHGHA